MLEHTKPQVKLRFLSFRSRNATFLMFIIALKVVVLHAHFILEIKAKGYEFISVNVFLHKIMRFLGKKG